MNQLTQWMAQTPPPERRGNKTRTGPKTKRGGLSPMEAAKILSKALNRGISKDKVRNWQTGRTPVPQDVLLYIG